MLEAMLWWTQDYITIFTVRIFDFTNCLLLQVPTEVNNCVQSLLLNYLIALLRTGDYTLVHYQMGELEYIRFTIDIRLTY